MFRIARCISYRIHRILTAIETAVGNGAPVAIDFILAAYGIGIAAIDGVALSQDTGRGTISPTGCTENDGIGSLCIGAVADSCRTIAIGLGITADRDGIAISCFSLIANSNGLLADLGCRTSRAVCHI